MSSEIIPVVCIDGPSGSGKGTIAARLARHLSWHLLDSGALYRLVALAARRSGLAFDDHEALTACARDLDVAFAPARSDDDLHVRLRGEDVSVAIRTDETGQDASVVAAIPGVRAGLLERQRAFRAAPGLVADGRDMGTVVFTDAPLKIFLTASAQARAERRHKQLMEKGVAASLRGLFDSIRERDERDAHRAVSPLRPADDAVEVDSTHLDVDEVFRSVLVEVQARGLGR